MTPREPPAAGADLSPRTPLLPALTLLLAYGAGLGLLAGGPDLAQVALTGSAAAFGYGLAAILGHVAGRLAMRDAEAGWALSRGAAQVMLVAITFVTLLVHFPAALFLPVPVVAGWLAARRGVHAPDVAFLGVVSTLLVAVPWHRDAWDDSGLFLLPALVVGAALVAREAWDLHVLRQTMDAQRRPPVAGGAVPGPVPARATRRALLAALLVTLAGLAVAAALGLAREGVRDAYASLGEASVRSLALAVFVAALAGVVWVLALWKKGRDEETAGAR